MINYYTASHAELLELAKVGDVEAQIQVAHNYLYGGNNVVQDPVAAEGWCQKAIDQGSTDAICALAYALYNGICLKQDKSRAIEMFNQVAEAGEYYHCELEDLAFAYEHGNGVEKDSEKALQLYAKINAEGIDSKVPWRLGRMYATGRGCERDMKKAVECWLEAEKRDWEEAKDKARFFRVHDHGEIPLKYCNTDLFNDLGCAYYFGEGCEQDESKGREYFQKAVDVLNLVDTEDDDIGEASFSWSYLEDIYSGDDVKGIPVFAEKCRQEVAEEDAVSLM